MNKKRDLGGLFFIDLRDRTGVVQLGFEGCAQRPQAKECPTESVIRATGVVALRPASARNPDMETGQVEVQVEEFSLLGKCSADDLPFVPCGPVGPTEELGLKYRYLELRHPRFQKNLKMRSQAMQRARGYLVERGFTEVETPILYKSTPEGARDYLVPSRVHPGMAYALPQSPQTLKQLLMVGGVEKYFQICRCFRDEDLRADRQPEFSQIDLEASFATELYFKNLSLGLMEEIFQRPIDLPSLSFHQAMEHYGTDRPDLRFDLKQQDVTSLFSKGEFQLFRSLALGGGLIKAMFLPRSLGALTRKEIDSLGKVAFFKVEGGGKLVGGISKFITPQIQKALGVGPEGTWFFVGHEDPQRAHGACDELRRNLGQSLKLYEEDQLAFAWIREFPLFEWSEQEGRLQARHHPFVAVACGQEQDFLAISPSRPREELLGYQAQAYDLVCNGHELGGGSLRIHQRPLQEKVFELLGLSPERAQENFGFFLEALDYGAPPHGGIAFGLDRIMMVLAGASSIREVMAFPKTTRASDLMSHVPAPLGPGALEELHLKRSF